MATTVTVNDLLDGHVALDVECLDRIYLNGYVPKLQVVGFMTRHLWLPIPSPAIMEKIGTGFRRAVRKFADDNYIPVVKFDKSDRKIERMRPTWRRRRRPAGLGWSRSGSRSSIATSRRRSPHP